MHNTIRIATFNIHKGFSHFNARFSLHGQRDLLRKLNADVIFLQEVQDTHIHHRDGLGSIGKKAKVLRLHLATSRHSSNISKRLSPITSNPGVIMIY